tara:strand:- start:29184 stop:30881 length:1698 start_codon:yes stop_codon:yes gene_type:complete
MTLVSCAHQGRKDQSSIRGLFAQKKFNEALSYLNKSTLKKDEKNRLLYLMERGSIAYYKQNYKRAASIFSEANQLVDKMYTKSIREKIASSVLNDNSESFYGSLFERSMLYYYQALSFYQLAEKGSYSKTITLKDGKKEVREEKLSDEEVKQALGRVRATLIAWDSFFEDFKRSFGGQSIHNHDLTSKVLAAGLHERLGTKRDLEISMQLYKDAEAILKRIGPAYKVYNNEFKGYNRELKTFLEKKSDPLKIKKDYITQTEDYRNTLNHLHFKILSFYKTRRKYQYKKMLNFYKPLQEVKEKLKRLTAPPMSFLIEVGMISELKGEDFAYNLRSAIANVDDPSSKALIEGIGVPVLTYFATGPLGLGYVSHQDNVSIYTQHNAGFELTKEVGIEFEMAKVAEPDITARYALQFLQNEQLVHEEKLVNLVPLNDISYLNAQEVISQNFSTRSVRVGVKYVLAIAAAYATYKKVKESSGELFARPAALTQFLLSQKAIKESEAADTRHWTTMPSYIYRCDVLGLKPGQYTVKFVKYSDSEKDREVVKNLGEFSYSPENRSLFSHRIF